MMPVLADVRFAVRLLRKSPAFTITALLCLGLGIGANTALFGILDTLVWKPLPVSDPGSLVRVFAEPSTQGSMYLGFSYPEYQDHRRRQDRLADLAASSGVQVAFRDGRGDPIRVFGEAVSDNYFRMLGIRPHLGRCLAPRDDESPNVQAEVVVSHRFWTRRLHAAPNIVGTTIWLTEVPFTVVGVTPPEFNGTYPVMPFSPEFWIPLGSLGRIDDGRLNLFDDRTRRSLTLLGRLRPGVGVSQAQAALNGVAAQLARAFPDTNRGVKVLVFRELDTHPEVYSSRAANLIAILFLALGGTVLLVACANLANLTLARAETRRKEIALRVALGAGRRQLVQQLVTEAMLLSLVAGMMGLAVAYAACRAVSSVSLPTDIPLVFDVVVDWRVFAFGLAASLVAGLAFGLVPAIGASRPDLVPALKGGEHALPSRRRFSTTRVLTVAQVALSLVLLVAAGLFWRSVAGSRSVDPGLALADRALVSFSPSLLRYDAARTAGFYRSLLEGVRRAPGIRNAALVGWVPLGFQSSEGRFVVQGVDTREGPIRALDNVVTPGFFETVGVRVREGRPFSERDTAETLPVAIVNDTFARRAWPGRAAVGRQFRDDAPGAPWLTVVGVVPDTKYRSLTETPRPYLVRPISQAPSGNLTLVVWGTRGHASTLAAVRREVQAIDPGMPMLDVKTMEQQMAKVRFLPQAMTALAGPAAAVATLIAAIGLYGVMAHSVGRRTREFGIKLAIGARTPDIIGQVMSRGLSSVAVGAGIGVAAALALGRLMRGLLVGVSAADPVVFVAALGLIVGVAVLASYLPARRASRVDPIVALRQE